MATIQEVAKLAGTSVGSVSHFINGKQLRPQTAARIQSAIDKLGYRANIFGKALRGQSSFSVGILVSNFDNIFSSSISFKISTRLEKIGYATLLMDYRGDHHILKDKINFLLSRQVDAIIIIMSEHYWVGSSWLETIKIPVIIIDNPISPQRFPNVVVDNEHSVSSVICKMFSLGHERIGMIVPPDDTYVGKTRRNGWYDAYAINVKSPNERDLIVCQYEVDSGYHAMTTLLDRKEVTAVFASNYYLALGALKAIFERHLILGKDIGFASFDDFGFSNIISPPVTVVQQPIEQMSKYVVASIKLMLSTNKNNWPKGIKMFNSHISYTNSIVRK